MSFFKKEKQIFKKAKSLLSKLDEADEGKVGYILLMYNFLFQDSPISTNSQEKDNDGTGKLSTLFHNVVYRYTIFGHTDRFCFEFALIFIDNPCEFNEIISLLPAPYTIALRIAYDFLLSSFGASTKGDFDFLTKKIAELENANKVIELLNDFISNKKTPDETIRLMQIFLPEKCFALFLRLLQPSLKIHYSIKYSYFIFRFNFKFDEVQMPIEFVQAIADINSKYLK